MKRILILGATSTIAQACARRWAEPGREFLLVGRDEDKLASIAADLRARGAGAEYRVMDMTATDSLVQLIAEAGAIDLALVAHGTLANQERCQTDAAYALAEFNNNAASTIAAVTALAARMEQQGRGQIAVLSSVAGDRGRPSNYLYGSAKAAVNIFCEGLQARLYGSGVHLMVVKPGFVDTPMTRHLDLPAALTSPPQSIARSIEKGLRRKRHCIYAPAYWRYIMWLIRAIPPFIFRRLKL